MEDYLKNIREKIGHKPIIVPHSVVILINPQNQVLLEERLDDCYFDFPGGGIDLGESAEEAAKRELFEETGLFAEELELFKVYSGEITHYIYANGDEIYGVDLVYICRLYHGELTPQPEEVKSLAFYDFGALPEKMWIRNKQIIEDFKNGK